MGLRDLGYKAYEGDRRATETNTWVLMRHGLRRAWGSWFVKAAALLCWVPPLLSLGYYGFRLWYNEQLRAGGFPDVQDVNLAEGITYLFGFQFWLFVTLISAGAGATVIAEDRTFGAFQFYFAKPVTPFQYLLGRLSAVAIWCFGVTFVPSLLLVVEGIALAPAHLGFENAGLFLPTLLYAGLVAIVTACTSIGISSLSKSRGLTVSAWACVLLIPYMIGSLVSEITESPWVFILSIARLLEVSGNALFKIEVEASELTWYYALPMLMLIAGGSVAIAYHRIRRAEVIT